MYLPIPFYFYYQQTTFIQADNGDVFDFVYTGGQSFSPEYEGYKVFGPDGSVVINQNITGQIPESTSDVKFCEDQSVVEIILSNQVSVYPNPTNGILQINAPSVFSGSEIKLIDIEGKIVSNWTNLSLIHI